MKPDAAVLVAGGPSNALHLAIADSLARGVGSGPEPAGGTLVIDFPGPTDVNAVTLADVAGAGGEVRAYQGATLLSTAPIPDLGGSGQWQIFVSAASITRLEVEFAGVGAARRVAALSARSGARLRHEHDRGPAGLGGG